LLASGAFALVGLLPDDQLQSWGWRIPFLFSAALVAVGLYMRAKVDETPVFKHLQQQHPEQHTNPVLEVFRKSWRSLLLIMV
jgi:MFS family permease